MAGVRQYIGQANHSATRSLVTRLMQGLLYGVTRSIR